MYEPDYDTGTDPYYTSYDQQYQKYPNYPSYSRYPNSGQQFLSPFNDSSSGLDSGIDPGFGSGGNSGTGSGSSSEVKTGTWLGPGIAGLIIGIIPITTLIASLIPAFISIPVISTSPFSRRRRDISDFDVLSSKKSDIFQNLIKSLSKYGMSSLEDPHCLSEMLCTFATDGTKSDNLFQKIVYYLIVLTPEEWSKWLSVDTLFIAIKQNTCEDTYKCMSSKRVKFKDKNNFLQ